MENLWNLFPLCPTWCFDDSVTIFHVKSIENSTFFLTVNILLNLYLLYIRFLFKLLKFISTYFCLLIPQIMLTNCCLNIIYVPFCIILFYLNSFNRNQFYISNKHLVNVNWNLFIWLGILGSLFWTIFIIVKSLQVVFVCFMKVQYG